MSTNRPQDVADILEGMTTPTPNEVYEATRQYDNAYISAAAASKAHAGGGGSQPLQSGNGTPVGAVTPTATGYVYIDLTNGGLWQAVGATNTDWVAVGGIADALRNGDGTYGVGFSQFGNLLLISQGTADVELVSADGMTNNSNAVSWGGADGTETLRVRTGSTGQHSGILQDANGNMTVPGKITAGGSPLAVAVSVPLTNAQILACQTTPIELVAAPGPGKALVVSVPFVQIIGQTVGYTLAGSIGIFADLTIQWAVFDAAFASSGDAVTGVTAGTGPWDVAALENLPLVFLAFPSDPTDGDGDAIVSFICHVVDVA